MNSMRDWSEQDWRSELDRINQKDYRSDIAMFFIGFAWAMFSVWLAFSV